MANETSAGTSHFQNTTALILAGGLGTRLREVVSDRPKVLADVQGRPFMEYLLNQVSSAGLQSAILCVGHMGEKVEQQFGSSYKSMRLSYSYEKELLGTAGALRLALPLMKTKTMLIMNGDSYCDIDVSAFQLWHENRNSTISIAVTEVEDTSRYGQVEADSAGNVIGFREKTQSQGKGLVNAGIYLIEKQIIESLAPGKVLSLERDVFPAYIGKHFYAWSAPHQIFIDIGTPSSYTNAQTLF